MKKILSLIVLTFSLATTNAQLFTAEKGWNTYFVEKEGNNVWIEVFLDSDQSFLLKAFDEKTTLSSESTDTLASFPNLKLIKKEGEYTILWRAENKTKFKKITLEQTTTDNRKELRRKVLMSDYRVELFNALDSLSGPEKYIGVDINEAYLTLADKELQEEIFLIEAKKLKESLAKEIEDSISTQVKSTYEQLTILETLSQDGINKLLSETNYTFFYGDVLLLELSKKNPQALVTYIDSEPENKKVILKKIKNHERIDVIIANVSKVSPSTEGKAEILLQEKKLNQKNKLKKLSSGTLLVAEVVMLTAVIIWFIRPK